MSTGVLLLMAVLVCCCISSVTPAPGTTDDIESIFIGRCYEYQDVINPTPFIDQKKNCSDLWRLFADAFAYKEACNVTVDNYEEFAIAAHHSMDTKDSVMFWEHVYPFVYEYSAFGRRYLAIRDYLPGYIVQTLEWCGQVGGSGMNFVECPEWSTCPHLAVASFWKSVSAHFARQVEGNVHVMLNGSVDVAFMTDSIFAEYELSNLNQTRNGKLDAFVVHDIGKPFKETCQTGSLLELKNLVEQKGIAYQCIDDPIDVLHLQCVDHVNDARCLLSSTARTLSSHSTLSFSVAIITWTISVVLKNTVIL